MIIYLKNDIFYIICNLGLYHYYFVIVILQLVSANKDDKHNLYLLSFKFISHTWIYT